MSIGSFSKMPIGTQRENNGMAMFLMFQQYDYLWLFLRNGRLHIIRNFLINYLRYKGSSVQEEANQAPRPLTLSKKNIVLEEGSFLTVLGSDI